jgi:prevent-host-death family protein
MAASRQVNLYDAKTHLSSLVEDAAAGEEIVIAKAGRPVARLVALAAPEPRRRTPGRGRGSIEIGEDFDDPLPPELAAAFAADPNAP